MKLFLRQCGAEVCDTIKSMAMRDQYIYDYALNHLRKDLARIEAMIETTRTTLGTRRKPVPAVPDESVPDWVLSTSEKAARAIAGKRGRKKGHNMTAEGKARIAAAQKKRWAAIRKAKDAKAESRPVKKKSAGKKARP